MLLSFVHQPLNNLCGKRYDHRQRNWRETFKRKESVMNSWLFPLPISRFLTSLNGTGRKVSDVRTYLDLF